jgi:L-fucose isomerase-like protein
MNNKGMKNDTRPKIIIIGGTKEWEVRLIELSSFLNQCYGIDIQDVDDMEIVLQEITEMVVDGADNNLTVSEIKKPLKFLRMLTFMLRSVLQEHAQQSTN